MATKTKKTTTTVAPAMPTSRERPRPGAIMVELSPADRAKLLSVQAACTEARGMPVPISWTVRLAIREMWDRLSSDDQVRLSQASVPETPSSRSYTDIEKKYTGKT